MTIERRSAAQRTGPRRGCPRVPVVATLAFAAGLALATPAAAQDAAPGKRAASLYDPRLDELRRASVVWDNRLGPTRAVVDVLCLAPDVPTYLEAVASWDRGHYFPVLLDDPETALRFARAFRPGRIVRLPARERPIPPPAPWAEAVAAVGRSWAEPDAGLAGALPGDAFPKGMGPTPPGVVLSAPDSPSLAGAVALAAGRFQPLIRWEPKKTRADILSPEDADRLATELEAAVEVLAPRYARLGDDCDFLTLAGDWPDRYNARDRLYAPNRALPAGTAAFDDLIGRAGEQGLRRWAFTGRLGGDATASIYRAMCSLFLRPRSALLFNGYEEDKAPWGDFEMTNAAIRLARNVPVQERAGPASGSPAGWHKGFGPLGGYDLLLINSHGHPTVFNLRGGPAQTADVPMTVPAAVLMIHSFSAADPEDPGTIAGRWLANGAFLYFGSLNEPFLDAFRTPTLLADLLASGLPFGAAARMGSTESPFGFPWRLQFLGDPLYRLTRPARRIPPGPGPASWVTVQPGPAPPPAAPAAERMDWAYRTALVQAGTPGPVDLAAATKAISRADLSPALRPRFDALVADTLFAANRPADLSNRLARIPKAEASPAVKRWLETSRVSYFQSMLAAGRWQAALAAWGDLVRSDSPTELKTILTARVEAAANPVRRQSWRNALRTVIGDLGPNAPPELMKEWRRLAEAR